MNQFVVADHRKCIGCRTCEVACTLAHGPALAELSEGNFAPRLQVVRTARVTVPIQCRQCEDAPCLKACGVSALLRRNGLIEPVAGRCIGCKACLMACPYGAIDLVFEPGRAGNGAVEPLKCDLCHQSGAGPACVRVCPTDALGLVQEADLVRQTREKRQRAAGAAVHKSETR
nr:4Fe-4S dicluster domain-containing protein [uncultured Holophaga sp.]